MATLEDTFCCMQCRLLQGAAGECAECGSPLMATLANQRSLLKSDLRGAATAPSPAKQVATEAAGMVGAVAAYAGVLAGAALWWGTIPLLVAGSVGAVTIAMLRGRNPIRAIDLLPVHTAPGAVMRRGITRRLADTVTSLAGERVLAESVLVENTKGILFRRTQAAPLLVELDGGARLVVLGQLRIAATPTTTAVKRGDPQLVALGLVDLPVKGDVHVSVVRDGDAVEVTGEETTEMVPELAFHRDAGETTVMRGRAKAVVAVRSHAET